MRALAAVVAVMAVSLASATARADTRACTRLALAVVIDRSGSMTGLPIDNAKAAASAAVDRLGPSDCVTIIAFDSAPTIVVPLEAVKDVNAVRTAIANIRAQGGTEILSALSAAHASLLGATTARRRHVVLLTDGISPVAGMQALAQTMSAEHMTLTSVGLGSSTDEPTLKMLSSTTAGRFYRVIDPSVLPRIFAREVDLAAP
jgi:Ca-activated chloride channel homolog